MKEDSNHPAIAEWGAYVFKRCLLLLLVLPALTAGRANAQSCSWNNMFHHGEQLSYDLYFKWGILMPKAGQAHFTVRNTSYRQSPAWEHKLLFNTSGMFDKIFKMRDTLTTYYSPTCDILFSSKRTDEGGYYLVDEMAFTRQASRQEVAVHSQRYSRTGMKIDTTLVLEGCFYDMMSSVMFLRSIDWKKLKLKDELPFRIVVGRDVVNVSFRYTGQAIVEPSPQVKYRTHHFFIDVYDPAFEQSKEAAEVWMGDDANHLPIRVRAKLTIGAAEIYFNRASNLKHPFTSRTLIPAK